MHLRIPTLVLLLTAAALVGAPTFLAAQAAPSEADAPEIDRAASAWIELLDEGSYRESWDAAGAYFRQNVTAEQWEEMARQVRESTGAVQSRSFVRSFVAPQAPDTPPGEYMISEYRSTFERMASALETVVTVRGEDGGWHVVGFFIRPG